MRALSLTQPYATLIAVGAKRIETRSWSTTYRGPIAIHASKGWPRWAKDACLEEPFRSVLERAGHIHVNGSKLTLEMEVGAIVAIARLYTVARTENIALDVTDPKQANERAFGDYTSGRFGWFLNGIRRVEPIPCKGALGLWTVPAEIAEQLEAR